MSFTCSLLHSVHASRNQKVSASENTGGKHVLLCPFVQTAFFAFLSVRRRTVSRDMCKCDTSKCLHINVDPLKTSKTLSRLLKSKSPRTRDSTKIVLFSNASRNSRPDFSLRDQSRSSDSIRLSLDRPQFIASFTTRFGIVPRLAASPCQAWWSQTGSNRRPPACKAGALPAELWPLRKLVGLGRFELPTSPLSGVRSNQLSYRPSGCC